MHYNMPPLYEWNPRLAVLLWLKSKECRYHTNRPKGKEQPYFRGISAGASKLSKGIDDDHDQDSITFTAVNEVNVNLLLSLSLSLVRCFEKLRAVQSTPVVSIEQHAVGYSKPYDV